MDHELTKPSYLYRYTIECSAKLSMEAKSKQGSLPSSKVKTTVISSKVQLAYSFILFELQTLNVKPEIKPKRRIRVFSSDLLGAASCTNGAVLIKNCFDMELLYIKGL